MTAASTNEKIIASMANMLERGIEVFTKEQLARQSGYSQKTIMSFTSQFDKKHVEVVTAGKVGRHGIVGTFRWLHSDIKKKAVKHVSRKALAEKWAGYCVDPEISSLSDFKPVGNVYHYR